jgi:hypothetical protein
MNDTYAQTNFAAKQQCRIIFGSNGGTNGLVKGLAIEEGSAKGLCVCQSREAYESYRRKAGAAGQQCIIQSDQRKITNFNQPEVPGNGGMPGNGGNPGLGNPGNEPGPCSQCNTHVGEVGNAGEDPPNDTGSHSNGNPSPDGDGTNNQTRGNSETAQQ